MEVWKQFGSLLVDILFVPIALVVLLSGFRTLSLVQILRGDARGMRKRGRAILLLGSTVLDLPFLLAALVPALTPWRTRPLWLALRLWDRHGPDAKERRAAACEQLLETLKDWAHVGPALHVLAVPWRSAGLWRELRLCGCGRATGGSSAATSATASSAPAITKPAAMTATTASPPPAITASSAATTTTSTLWLPGAAQEELAPATEASRTPSAAARRAAIREHFCETMADHPHVIMGALVVLLCPWRAWHLLASAKPWPGATRTVKPPPHTIQLVTEGNNNAAANAAEAEPAPCTAPNPSASSSMGLEAGGRQCVAPDMKLASARRAAVTAEERRAAARSHFFGLVVDVPVLLMAVLVLLTGWRARLLWRALRIGASQPPAAYERWGATCVQALRLLRDVPFLLLAPCTLHRLPRLVLKIVATRKRVLNTPPLATITAARGGCDAVGRLRLRLTASKPAELAATQVRVTVGGDSFWEGVGACYGSLANVGKALLPAKVVPKYLELASELATPGNTTAQLVFTFPSAAEKGLRKLWSEGGNAPMLVQAQCDLTGSSASESSASGKVGVLFELVLSPSDLLHASVAARNVPGSSTCTSSVGLTSSASRTVETASQPPVGDMEHEDGVFGPATLHALPLDARRPAMGGVEPLQDVAWSLIAVELLEVIIDVVRVLATIALLLAPWRFCELAAVSLEPLKRWPLRVLDRVDRYLHDECAHADKSIDALRERLTAAARGGEIDFPPPQYASRETMWRGPSLPDCRLYLGLAATGARESAIKTVRKYDNALGNVWSDLLALHPTHRLLAIMHAELLRGVLSPTHWGELKHAISRFEQAHASSGQPRGRLGSPSTGNNPLLGGPSRGGAAASCAGAMGGARPATGVPVAREPTAAELLRTVDNLREAVERERGVLRQQISDARATRREALRACKVSAGAVCKRSSAKGRQQLVAFCREALFDWLAFAGFLMLLGSFYRLPTLLRSLRGVTCVRSVRVRVTLQLRQMPSDILMALELCLLTLAFWQAIETWLEWSELVLARRDVRAARKAVHRRVGIVCSELLERLCLLLTPFFWWDTYRFVLATLCFGVLVPVHLLGKLLAALPCLCLRRAAATAAAEPTSCHFWLAGALWAALVAVPFAIVYRLAPAAMAPLALDANGTAPALPPPSLPPLLPPPPVLPTANGTALNYTSPPPAADPPPIPHVLTAEGAVTLPLATGSYLGIILLLGVLSSGVALASSELLSKAAPRRAMRWTAANGAAICEALLEMTQLVALPFLALHAASRLDAYQGHPVLRDSGPFHVLRRVADVVLLWQPTGDASAGQLTALVYTAFGALCVWYILFSLPIVIDELLQWRSSHGRVQSSRLWHMLMHSLHTTLHLCLVMQLLKPLGCTHRAGQAATLFADPSISCWDPHDRTHARMAICSLVGIAFYLVSVHVLSADGGLLRTAQQAATLDVRYSELYAIVQHSTRAAAAFCFIWLYDEPTVLLAVLLALYLGQLLWTVGFHRIFCAPACAIRGVVELRAVGDAVGAWAALSCLLQLRLSTSSTASAPPAFASAHLTLDVSEIVCLGGWAAIVAAGLLWSAARRRLAARERRAQLTELRECAKLVLDIESYWEGQGGVISTAWKQRASAWRRATARATDVPTLCRRIVQLEQHVRAGIQLQAFMTSRRAAWQHELERGALTIPHIQGLVNELRDSVVVVARPLTAGGSDASSAAQTESAALLASWRSMAHGFFGQFIKGQIEHNGVRISYKLLYAHLQLLKQHAAACAHGDETDHGVACGVTMPAMVVAGIADGVSVGARGGGSAAAVLPAVSPAAGAAPVAVGLALVGGGLAMEAAFETLRSQLHAAPTNLERIDLVDAFTRQKPCRLGAPRLSCDHLRVLAELVTLSSRRKHVLVALHPYLSDKENFYGLVEEQLSVVWDREEVRRQAAKAERDA